MQPVSWGHFRKPCVVQARASWSSHGSVGGLGIMLGKLAQAEGCAIVLSQAEVREEKFSMDFWQHPITFLTLDTPGKSPVYFLMEITWQFIPFCVHVCVYTVFPSLLFGCTAQTEASMSTKSTQKCLTPVFQLVLSKFPKGQTLKGEFLESLRNVVVKSDIWGCLMFTMVSLSRDVNINVDPGHPAMPFQTACKNSYKAWEGVSSKRCDSSVFCPIPLARSQEHKRCCKVSSSNSER